MKHRYGVSWADQYLGNTSLWKHQEEQAGTFGREETLQKETLESLLEEQEAELPTEENPMAHVGVLKSTPILNLVLPKDKQVSEKRIVLSDMPEKRQNQTGYGSFEDVENDGNTLSSVLMGEYALEHFGAFTEAAKGGALDYELEYILGGKESDGRIWKRCEPAGYAAVCAKLPVSAVKQCEAGRSKSAGRDTVYAAGSSGDYGSCCAGDPSGVGIWGIRDGCTHTL